MNHCPNPRCLSDDVEIDLIERPRMADRFQGYCGGCGVRGPIEESYEEAESGWDGLSRGEKPSIGIKDIPTAPA